MDDIKTLTEEIRVIEATLMAKKEELRQRRATTGTKWVAMLYGFRYGVPQQNNYDVIELRVFSTEQEAREWAGKNWPDGHYRFETGEMDPLE